ncbi:Potassium channel protein [hydrothermal vent metagenome]|uniref:Potassium channel protein n=1 Tax=hydrothermal vent metagenome TaxID=652676 RepID=A0A1W1C027_9ZZZZ
MFSMFHRKKVFMFGYSTKSSFVAKELKKYVLDLHIILSKKEAYEDALADGYSNVKLLDLTDDEVLEELDVAQEDYLICLLRDNHLNLFLALSLHSLFPNSTLIALSDSPETTKKLKMAGASKTIDLYQVSTLRLHNILNKPITTKLVEEIFSFDTPFSLREMTIPENSSLDGIMVDDFDFYEHNIILVGMIDRRLSEQFIFSTSGVENRLDVGDTLVCVGYSEDLEKFERYMDRD